ncbi:MAG: RagB/SusD family nutrient uptake outer membrane protein [Chitinophagaceae bacterium]|nr:MAG: RagB/SusD family nutrient uptake outer membrane protein [Chitinophagaceae bacterium]
MKKLIYSLFALSLVSCSKDYLYKNDPTRLSSEGFYKNATEMNQALVGSYSQLQDVISDQWLLNEMIADNTTVDFNPGDRGFAYRHEGYEYWTITSNNSVNTAMYNRYYNAVYNVNSGLMRLAGSATVPDADKAPIEGQFRFLRAYYYFQLVQYYGDLILVLEPFSDPSKAYEFNRVPAAEVYTQIEADLSAAVEKLPLTFGASQAGRITKGAALGLLGKVYLTQKKYPQAITALNQVTGYSLNADYADNFDPALKNGPESLFEVQYDGSSTLGEWSGFIYVFGPRESGGAVTGFPQSNPSGWNIPTKDIIAAYEPGDLRKEASVGLDYTRPVTNEVVPYIRKYAHPHAVYGRSNDNWPVLRYADVLLMLAEAINEESGPGTDAYTALNLVRQRAGLAPLAGLDKAGFRAAVLKERRVELAFENWRWFDLKRTNTSEELATILNAHGAAERANPTVSRQGIPFSATDYVFSGYEALYPIPADELLINKNLTQNPGY